MTKTAGDTSAVEKRIARLESELAELKAEGVKPEKSPKNPPVYEKPPVVESAPQQQEQRQPAEPETDAQPEPCRQWEDILDRLTAENPGCAGALQGSEAFTKGDKLLILVKNEFFLGLFKKAENAASLKKAALDVTGVEYKLLAKCVKTTDNPLPDGGKNPVDELIERAKSADIPVDVE